jgi:hypothetical protein
MPAPEEAKTSHVENRWLRFGASCGRDCRTRVCKFSRTLRPGPQTAEPSSHCVGDRPTSEGAPCPDLAVNAAPQNTASQLTPSSVSAESATGSALKSSKRKS